MQPHPFTRRRPGALAWIAGASLAAACFSPWGPAPAHAQATPQPRLKTESPYFFVKSDDPVARPLAAQGHRRST